MPHWSLILHKHAYNPLLLQTLFHSINEDVCDKNFGFSLTFQLELACFVIYLLHKPEGLSESFSHLILPSAL